MNLVDILIICAIAAAVIAAIVFIIIRKRKGKSCSCSCDNCPYPCHKKILRSKDAEFQIFPFLDRTFLLILLFCIVIIIL